MWPNLVANNCLLADNIKVSSAIFHVTSSPIKTPAHQFLSSSSLFISCPSSLPKHLVHIQSLHHLFITDNHLCTRQATTPVTNAFCDSLFTRIHRTPMAKPGTDLRSFSFWSTLIVYDFIPSLKSLITS